MKKRIFIILVCLTIAVPCGLSRAEEAGREISLSLDTAIYIAFANNKDIRIQEQELDVSKAKILGARSEFLPTVNVGTGYTRNGAVLKYTSTANPKKDPGIFTGYENNNLLSATVNQTVYNGGANVANFKQSLLGLDTSEVTLRAKKLDVEFEAKRLYYGLLLAYETERIAQELVDQAQAHYEDVQHMYEQGTASRFDLLQSKVAVSKLVPELVKAKNSIDLIKADLKKLLGFKMQDNISVDERLQYTQIEIKEGEFLKEAYLNQPEMILKSLGIDIDKWSIQMAKAGWRPQVNASGTYVYQSNDWSDMVNSRHGNWQAGVSVNFPIFDAWSSKAKVDEAKAKYRQAILAKANVSDQIALDIRQACLDLRQSEAIIESQRENVDEAKEALRISIVSFENGVGTNLDVLDSQTSLAQVQQNLSQGIYDYLMAEAFLDRTRAKSFIVEVKNEKKD
ncbi:MAG: TolC family protein [Candidatus Omnitrophica bacterium]|nr:TolC family protein [Candidatus Omnitrophota bacterium]